MKYYYVSIAYYGHKVYKCAGQCPDETHRERYTPLFEKRGTNWTTDYERLEREGPYTVLIVDGYLGDRIRRDGDNFVEFRDGDEKKIFRLEP